MTRRTIQSAAFRIAPTRPAACAVLALALVLGGCQQRLGGLAPWSFGGDGASSSAGGTVTVAQGDTLYALSRRYQVPLRDLIDVNRLSPPYNIEPGQRLTLPTSRQYIVQPGDTLYGVSRMFNVDVSELTRLNNLSPPYALKSGQPLRLPSPSAGSAGGGARPPEAPPQVAAAPRSKIERTDHSSTSAPTPIVPAPIAPVPTPTFNPDAPSVVYQPGQEPRGMRPPGAPPAAGTPTPLQTPAAPSLVPAAPTQITPVKKPVPAEPPADAKPAETASPPETVAEKPPEPVKEKPREIPAARPAPTPAQPPQQAQTATVAPPPRAPDAEPPPRAAGRFLMPVKGPIISGFGPKPGGQHNDGINISAARGTAVAAADNGVVAYVGNELRGFGNLLLIRHADGWVTAYAHLDHISVERGAEVKRGQKVGAVGQSGGVPAPQLHFEIRKGSQAVDPKDQM